MPKLHGDVQAVCHTKVGRISVIIKLGEFCCQTLPNSTEHLWTFFSGFTLQCIGKKTLYGWQKPQAFATPQKFKVPFLRWVNAKFLSECFERFTLVSVNSGFGKDITIITEIFTHKQNTKNRKVSCNTWNKYEKKQLKYKAHGAWLSVEHKWDIYQKQKKRWLPHNQCSPWADLPREQLLLHQYALEKEYSLFYQMFKE